MVKYFIRTHHFLQGLKQKLIILLRSKTYLIRKKKKKKKNNNTMENCSSPSKNCSSRTT